VTLELTTRIEGLPRVGGHDVAAQIRCHRCGEPIAPEEGGRVLWEPDPKERYLDVVFLHARCVEAHQTESGGEPDSADLASFLAALIHNLEEAG
jgi:hypothetical protein